MAWSIILIVIVRCRKLAVENILIFVALCDYENFSTAKISRFTVHTIYTVSGWSKYLTFITAAQLSYNSSSEEVYDTVL